MVVKISAPTPHCSTVLLYNEKKVADGEAAAIYSQGIDDRDNPLETFDRYERGSLRCQKMSFHMSINPSTTDRMTQGQVVEFAKDLMEGLGYGAQPFIIYRHNDIEREHFHVVSVRVDKDGRKIPDQNEHRRCQQLMKELAAKYGFTIGKDKTEEEDLSEDNAEEEEQIVDYQRFDPKRGEYMRQMEELVEQAMQYHFTTFEQFKMLMKQFGVDVDYQIKKKKAQIALSGIDPKSGKKCTAPFLINSIKARSYEELRQHFEESKGEKRDQEKERVANLARIALRYGTSELHTRRILRRKNIAIVFSRTIDGRIIGVTFIDHQTRNIFKCSELKGVEAKMFEDARMTKWPEEDREWKIWEEPQEKSAVEEAADTILAVMATERSRRNEDEEIMRRGRHR